jgi:hypothetical protein
MAWLAFFCDQATHERDRNWSASATLEDSHRGIAVADKIAVVYLPDLKQFLATTNEKEVKKLVGTGGHQVRSLMKVPTLIAIVPGMVSRYETRC